MRRGTIAADRLAPGPRACRAFAFRAREGLERSPAGRLRLGLVFALVGQIRPGSGLLHFELGISGGYTRRHPLAKAQIEFEG